MRACIPIVALLWGTLPLLAQTSPSPAPPELAAKSPIDAARTLVEAGRLPAAEDSLRAFLAAHPDSADAHFLLGYVLFREQKAKLSLAEFTAGARYRKPSEYDLVIVGCDYVLLKDYEDADKWFSKSFEWNPTDSTACYYLGRAKYNENRFDEAAKVFQQCLKLTPKDVKLEDNLGLSYEGMSQNEQARTAYRLAIEWDAASPAKNWRPYLDLGTLLVAENHPADALEYLRHAADSAPREAITHRALGKAYLHLEQLDLARKELETAVQLDDASGPAHFILAQVYRKLNLPDKARAETARYAGLTRASTKDGETEQVDH